MDRKTREALLVAKNVTSRASGGPARPFGLYSKAADVARNLPQEKGTVDQMVAMLRKAGVKPAEIEHAGMPTGKTITRDELAKHFEDRAPNIKVSQYGEDPSSPVRSDAARRMNEIMRKWQNATPEERDEWSRLDRMLAGNRKNVFEDEDEGAPAPTQYEDYLLPGGQDYRERLIHLPAGKPEKAYVVRNYYTGDSRTFSDEAEARAYADKLERESGGERSIVTPRNIPAKGDYISSHWQTPNVLAHIRLTDRTTGWNPQMTLDAVKRIADHMGANPHELGSGAAKYGVENGLITPEEAATISKRYGWRNEFSGKKGAEKRILHVEELQSDWAQGGRDKGFYNQNKPYQIFKTDTGETVSEHPTYEEMWDAFRKIPDEEARGLDYGHAGQNDAHPSAPYVKNTQHWTDLALKNVLHEAAAGGYDHVVFSPGQANADRYGLEKQVSRLQLVRHPDSKTLGTLNAWDKSNRKSFSDQVTDEKHLASIIGREAADKLLSAPKVDAAEGFGFTPGTYAHTLEGEDMRVGGKGMKAYYDQIVPKSVMRLAQQHDPDIQPGTMELPGTEPGQTYQGFSIPVTDKLRKGILESGQTMFRRGGRVGYNSGGYVPQATLPVGRLRTAIPHRAPQTMNAGQALQTLASLGEKAVGLGQMLGYGDQPQPQDGAQAPAQAAQVGWDDVKPQSFNVDDAMRERLSYGINSTAEALGMDPLDLATIISYETSGTFDPMKTGPTTKWGTHRGLIQFGEPQAREYGVDWNDPLGSQLGPEGAVAKYFRSRGWKPEMGIFDAYSIVNAGSPGLYNASDEGAGGAPGTVAEKVRDQFAPHRAKAMWLLQQRQPGQAYASGGSVGGQLEKARAEEAVDRAGGQIAPSKYLPDVPRAVHADGGEVTDLGAAREQKQLRDFHGNLMGDIRSRMSALGEAHQKAVDAGAFDGYQVGDTLAAKAGPMKITNMFVRKWKPSSFMLRHFDRMGVEPTLIEHEGEQYIPMLRYQTGREGDPDWQEGDAYMDMVRASGYPKMGGLRTVKAGGGSISGRDQFYEGMHPDLMDEEGKPLDLYHGTPGASFDAFDDKKIGERDAGFYGRGHYLTPRTDIAEEYAGDEGNVMGPLHAALKNPFVWDVSDEASADRTKRKLADFGVMKGHEGRLRPWDNLQRWEVDKFTRAAMNAGHDGVIMKGAGEPTEIVVFNPAKIKHATENSGAFDTTNPSIYKAAGGPVDGDPQAIPGAPQTRPAPGEFPVAGGLGGGSGLLPAPDQTRGEADLEGLPKRVKIPLTGEVIETGHDPRIRQVARDYMASAGLPYNPPTRYAKVDPKRSARIAAAYEAMPHEPDNPLVRASYAQMIKETMDQYRAAKAAGFKAEFWNPETEADPYEASPRLAVEDVRKNHHMYVYPTSAGYGTGQSITDEDIRQNPMLMDSGERWNGIPVTVNDIFRAVHDYYGHAKEGVGFRADGEENAWRAHASMFSPLARMAMTTETRGQNSWLNYGPHGEANRTARTEDTVFAPQKIGVLPHWAHHEGAEDFITPESSQKMAEYMRKHGKLEKDVVGDALKATRGAFADGGAPGFFSREAGQARRQALNDAVSRFIPPELRTMAGFAGSMTPVAGLERAGQATQRAFDPSAPTADRVGAGAEALAETLGVAAPLALAGRAAVPATRIAQEVLTGGGYNPDFGQGWQDVYHWSRSPEAFDTFNPEMSREAFSKIGPHVGTQRAAYDRYLQEPTAVGQTIPLKANLSRPFSDPVTGEPFSELQMQEMIAQIATDQNVDLPQAARMIREGLAREGYTHIPYRNDAEDPGSISHIMLTERPAGSEAVLRSRFAEFSPHRATSPNLSAAVVPAAVGTAGYAAYDGDYGDDQR